MLDSRKITAPNGVLFLSDLRADALVPEDTSVKNVTNTETCIAFWVMHEVDGEVIVELTDTDVEDMGGLSEVFSGNMNCESSIVCLFQPGWEEISRIEIGAKIAKINIYTNDDSSPDHIVVRVSY